MTTMPCTSAPGSGARVSPTSPGPSPARSIQQRRVLHRVLDPYRDLRTGYGFAVSSGGVQGDSYHPEDEEDNRDPAYNPVWESSISFDSLGWYVEMRIPLSQIRFNTAAGAGVGPEHQPVAPRLQRRHLLGRDSPNPDRILLPLRHPGGNERHPATARGGVHSLCRGRRPVCRSPGGGQPLCRWRASPTSASVPTIKVGLGSNLTLDATINPDFGQVEADPPR